MQIDSNMVHSQQWTCISPESMLKVVVKLPWVASGTCNKPESTLYVDTVILQSCTSGGAFSCFKPPSPFVTRTRKRIAVEV